MPSGGARAKSGPARSLDSGRSDRKGIKVRTLPAEGYSGPVPDFPMRPQGNDLLAPIEERLWGEVWRLPQAAAWAAEPWRIYVVAQWVRLAAACEMPGGTAADRTAMLRFQEEIGLTGPGLARNGWVIGDAASSSSEESTPVRRRRSSSRDRMAFKVIDGEC